MKMPVNHDDSDRLSIALLNKLGALLKDPTIVARMLGGIIKLPKPQAKVS